MLRTKFRTLIRNATGYDIHKFEPGQNALNDIKRLVDNKRSPVLFDVGANVGQTVDDLLETFPDSQIHAFEPGNKAFQILSQRHAKGATLNNVGLGSEEGELQFFESDTTDMSSFLPTGPHGWGTHAIERKPVAVTTIDAYCARNGIRHIDLLKTDTQGFELEVLKGAQSMFAKRGISLLYIEIIFAKLYENQARADDLLRFAFDHGFELVSFYKMSLAKGRAGWTEALFALG